jgi:hypothetical protein
MQGGLPPGQAMHAGAQPNGAPAMHPQTGAPAAAAHPQAPKPPVQQAAKPPKNEKHDHEHEQGNSSR